MAPYANIVIWSVFAGRVIINGFGICYMLSICVCVLYFSPIDEVWIFLSGMFSTPDKKNGFSVSMHVCILCVHDLCV